MTHEICFYNHVCARIVFFHLTCKLQERRYRSIYSSYFFFYSPHFSCVVVDTHDRLLCIYACIVLYMFVMYNERMYF